MHYIPFTHTPFSLYFVFSLSPQIPGHKLAYFRYISKYATIIFHFVPITRQINTTLSYFSFPLSLLPQLPTIDTILPKDISGRSYRRKRRKIHLRHPYSQNRVFLSQSLASCNGLTMSATDPTPDRKLSDTQ